MMLPNTPEDIVTKLRMFRGRYPRHSLLLVEGQTDEALWTEYIDDRCRLIPTGNKEKAIKALDITNTMTTMKGVSAIVDPDYWLVEQSNLLNVDNLLFDDSPDMELMLLTTPALEKVIRHTFVSEKTDKIHQLADSLRAEALRLACEFGYFRLLDFRHREYNLMLRRVADNFDRYVNEGTPRFNVDDVVETLLGESHAVTAPELVSQVETLKTEISLDAMLCRGKDAISLLAFLLPRHFKAVFERDISQKARNQTTGNELFRALRMAFEFAHFAVTKLYARIRAWEAANLPFYIIRTGLAME